MHTYIHTCKRSLRVFLLAVQDSSLSGKPQCGDDTGGAERSMGEYWWLKVDGSCWDVSLSTGPVQQAWLSLPFNFPMLLGVKKYNYWNIHKSTLDLMCGTLPSFFQYILPGNWHFCSFYKASKMDILQCYRHTTHQINIRNPNRVLLLRYP